MPDVSTDTVLVRGTNARDRLNVTASGPQVLVSGLAALVRIAGQEVTHDTLRIETLLGDDDLTISPDVTSINIAADLGADG